MTERIGDKGGKGDALILVLLLVEGVLGCLHRCQGIRLEVVVTIIRMTQSKVKNQAGSVTEGAIWGLMVTFAQDPADKGDKVTRSPFWDVSSWAIGTLRGAADVVIPWFVACSAMRTEMALWEAQRELVA